MELSKLGKVLKKPTEEMSAPEHWAVFFRYLTHKAKRGKINEIIACEEGIKMASEVLMTISKDEVERARLMSEYKYQLDTQSKLVNAKREGIREGVLKGEQNGRANIARNALAEGASVEFVQKITGLDMETIKQMKSEKYK
jgi:predicted transposase/invertase (TIGR01784 family)